MDRDQFKRLDYRKLKPNEAQAVDNILRERGSELDEATLQTAIDRERKSDNEGNL